MTALAEDVGTPGGLRSPDHRSTAPAAPVRWALALLLPVGPFAVAALRYLLPYYTAGTNTAAARDVADAGGRQGIVLWLGYLAILTLVPGVLVAAQVCRPASPRLTTWAVALVVPAYLSAGLMLSSDEILYGGAAARLAPATTAAILGAAHPTLALSQAVFVAGHVVGTVLLGLALLRSHRIPAWAAWAVTVSQPLHFFAFVVLANRTLDMIAWSLTGVGMALVAAAVLRGPSATRGLSPVGR